MFITPPLNVYAPWWDICYCLWRLQISNNTADDFNWHNQPRQPESFRRAKHYFIFLFFCQPEFGELALSFIPPHNKTIADTQKRPFSLSVRLMEDFSRRSGGLGRIHGRRKRMGGTWTDWQAAVGDQLTTGLGGICFRSPRERQEW